MKSFVRLCLSRPITTLTVHVLLLMAGIMSLQHLPLSALPDFSQNRINVRVPYPNASPTHLRQARTTRAETHSPLAMMCQAIGGMVKWNGSKGTILDMLHTSCSKYI